MREIESAKLRIRPFQLKDLNGVLDIERQCFKDPWLPNMFKALFQFNPEGFFIAILDDKIVGYGVVLIEQSSINQPKERAAHLLNLAVHPRFRNMGIGKGIVGRFIIMTESAGIKEIYLEVRDSNRDAKSFYEKLGFKRAGLLVDFYGDEDAVVMSKSI
jgi:ribosomal-protein-alanine N-acetyltransferase